MELFFAVLEDDVNLLKYYKLEIENVLEKHNIPGEVVCATDNPELFKNSVRSGKVNVCIIDINLKTNTNGMQLAKEIREERIPVEIIFVTGHLQYMKSAFQVRAFDYLEKPVTAEDFERCLLRLHKEMDVETAAKHEVFKVKSGTVVYHIPMDDIIFVEHNGLKSVIVTKDKNIETYETLANLARELPKDKFKQCHRSIWVNIDHIEAVSLGSDKITFRNGMQCSLSRTFRKEFAKYEG